MLEDACDKTCGVKNVGHGNSCLIADDCLYGTRLVDSFDDEVLSLQPDLILVGIGRNDLCHLPTELLVVGYQDLRARAGAAGVPIRFATITPVNGSWPYPCEEQRVEVNDWLRTLPGTIDMETRVSTPAGLLRSAYDYQDGLHFNARGYEAMGRFALRTVRADLARIVARKASTRN